MNYGTITVDLNRVPLEVSVLVEDRRLSGAFIANRAQRGIRIASATQQIDVTADDALLLLEWLQEQAPALRAMLDEESAALATVDQRVIQTEGERATVAESLRAREV
jgi:hypothetical protein